MPPRLQPIRLSFRPCRARSVVKRCRSAGARALLGPRFRPSFQPWAWYPRSRRNQRSACVERSFASHPGSTRTGWPSPAGARPRSGSAGSRAANSSQARPPRASRAGEGGRIVSTVAARHSADTRPPASRGRPAPRHDHLDAFPAREPEPLDREADRRELARRRIAGTGRREPPGRQDEDADRPPPERPRLAVVEEDERRARRQPIAQRGEERLPLRRPRRAAEEGDDGGGRYLAVPRSRETPRERSEERRAGTEVR